MTEIKKSSFKFLKDIAKNNNREWFKKNKDSFLVANENMKDFLESVEAEMNKTDAIEKTKLFRIYRDVRFSKDKTPYNGHFSMSMSREGAFRRGGYYIYLKPNESMVGGGFWNPEPKDIKLIRDHIVADDKPLRKILKSKKFKDMFGELQGNVLKTAPRGFDPNHPAIDLIRYKSMVVKRDFTDKEVMSPDFLKEVAKTFKGMRPFFNYMTDILTHDLDGVPLYTE
ncbi:MAG: DUF2461 domain-containing protein [Saprospiraceae bacterium]|nr:DUF2461 domain-containing protein [Bacteroidia bacterium]NNE15146.1 DUF2461 domain-containing protein [Saprospiraceae bacterium]NNL92975.1 DUF2461 domain-containing protein [Saprospiraceae bacterium]